MKLRNKKTGEIYTACRIIFGESIEGLEKNQWKTLEEFNEDWEDYEEPKDYWFIDSCGGINKQEYDILGANRREIGNYFETKEEAEKSVEKLKAWKRLKEKGFKFIGVRTIGKVIDFVIPRKYCGVSSDSVDEETLEFYHDLDLLFGGEE